MGKWAALLAEKVAAPPFGDTDKADKRGVLSVVAVPPEGGDSKLQGGDAATRPAPGRPYKLTLAQGDAAHPETWHDAARARFVARMGLFMRRGIDATDADDLAERLHLRDVEGDERRLCVECEHLAGRASSGWRCGNARAAGVASDLPAELVTMAQRCAGFKVAS